MRKQEFIEDLRKTALYMLGIMQDRFPNAEVKATIGTVPDDPEYISLVLSAEYRTKANGEEA